MYMMWLERGILYKWKRDLKAIKGLNRSGSGSRCWCGSMMGMMIWGQGRQWDFMRSLLCHCCLYCKRKIVIVIRWWITTATAAVDIIDIRRGWVFFKRHMLLLLLLWVINYISSRRGKPTGLCITGWCLWITEAWCNRTSGTEWWRGWHFWRVCFR